MNPCRIDLAFGCPATRMGSSQVIFILALITASFLLQVFILKQVKAELRSLLVGVFTRYLYAGTWLYDNLGKHLESMLLSSAGADF